MRIVSEIADGRITDMKMCYMKKWQKAGFYAGVMRFLT